MSLVNSSAAHTVGIAANMGVLGAMSYIFYYSFTAPQKVALHFVFYLTIPQVLLIALAWGCVAAQFIDARNLECMIGRMHIISALLVQKIMMLISYFLAVAVLIVSVFAFCASNIKVDLARDLTNLYLVAFVQTAFTLGYRSNVLRFN